MAKDYAAASRKAEKFGTHADESSLKHSGEREDNQRNSTEAARTLKEGSRKTGEARGKGEIGTEREYRTSCISLGGFGDVHLYRAT